MIEVLALCGSLRRHSLNRRLLQAAAARVPPDLAISIYGDLSAVPVFNEDLEAHGGPDAVARLRAAVARTGAMLVATPEYNQSMPGVIKNIVDWLSRSEPELLAGKPIALLGATQGPWGTRLAQAALRQTLTACGALIMPAPQLYLARAGEMFDADGALADERVSGQLTSYLVSFAGWIEAMRPR